MAVKNNGWDYSYTGPKIGGNSGGSGGSGSVYMGGPKTAAGGGGNVSTPGTRPPATSIGDLTISSSAYGQPRPIIYGRMRVGSNIIWADPEGIRYREDVTISADGTTPAESNVVYWATFAVAIAEGPIDAILRIWADGKLIYDRRADSPVVSSPGLNFRLYLGTETQEPDAAIVALEGLANTPAYRGTAYVVFYNLPLSDYGNKIPTLEFEVAASATSERQYQASTHLDYSIAGDWDPRFTIDWKRDYLLIFDESADVVNRVDLRSMETDYESYFPAMTDPAAPASIGFGFYAYTPDGGVIGSFGSAGSTNSSPIIKLDPFTLRETGRIGVGSNGLGITPVTGPFRHNTAWAVNSAYDETHRRDFAVGHYPEGDSAFMLVRTDEAVPEYIWDTDNFQGGMSGYLRTLSVCAGAAPIGEGYCDFYLTFGPRYAAGASADNILLAKLRVYMNAKYDTVSGEDLVTGVEFIPLEIFTPASFQAGETLLNQACATLMYDAFDDCLIFCSSGNTTGEKLWHKYDPVLLDFVWTSEPVTEIPNNTVGQASSRINGGKFGYMVNAAEGFLIDAASGELLINGDGDAWPVGPSGAGFGMYDDYSGVWIGINDTSNLVYKFQMDGANTDGVTLQSIIEDLCSRAELDASDYDASDLSSLTIPGYGIAGATTARSAMEPLAYVYQFDGYESDWQLKFDRRGKAPVRTLTQEDDLGVTDNETGDIYAETRQQEIELPWRYTLTYLDHESDYLQNSHSAQRPKGPDATMYSNNRDEFQINAALDVDTAKQQAERLLYSKWAERVNYAFRISWEHLDLDPSDVLNVETDAGITYTGRMNSQDIGDTYDMEINISGERQEQYFSAVLADGGTGFRQQTVDTVRYVFAKVVDSPYLSVGDAYEDNTLGHLYCFAAGLRADDFVSCRWFRSADNVTFDPIGQTVAETTWGRVIEALADPVDDNPYAIDEVNSITIDLRAGTAPATVTRLEMLNGANRMMIVKDNGEVELIHFQTVVDNGDGTYVLSNLMRGMRGTDTMCWDHTENELFIMVDEGQRLKSPIAYDQDGIQQFFRTIGPKVIFQDGVRNEPTPVIRSLMPWKPGNVRASDVAGDIVFTWNRRDRLGNDMRDYTGEQPVNEDSVSFTLRIYDGAGGTLLRTVTGITAETYTYAAADITTDWGSMPATVWVQLEQVSAQVGAGFTREDEVDVE